MNAPNQDGQSDAAAFHDEWLTAYLDGELTEAQRQVVEERLANDPNARQLLEELRHVRTLVASMPTWGIALEAFQPTGKRSFDDLDDGLNSSVVAPNIAEAAPVSTIPVADNYGVQRDQADAVGAARAATHRSKSGESPLKGSQSNWSRLALAACTLLAVGIGLALWQGSQPDSPAVGLSRTLQSPASDSISDAPAEEMEMDTAAVDTKPMAKDSVRGAEPAAPQLKSPSAERSMPRSGNAELEQDVASAQSAGASAQAETFSAEPFWAATSEAAALAIENAPPQNFAMDSEPISEPAPEQPTAPEPLLLPGLIAYDNNWTSAAIRDQLLAHPALIEIQSVRRLSRSQASQANQDTPPGSSRIQLPAPTPGSDAATQRSDAATQRSEATTPRSEAVTMRGGGEKEAGPVVAAERSESEAGSAVKEQLAQLDLTLYDLTSPDRQANTADKVDEGSRAIQSKKPEDRPILLFVSSSTVDLIRQRLENSYRIQVLSAVSAENADDTEVEKMDSQLRILVLTPLAER